jgi:hypothetical protein
MQYYTEFYHLSTGYIPRSIPPIFKESNKKLIPAIGSDSVLILDGRNSLDNMCEQSKDKMKRLNTNLNKGYKGFKIHKSNSFLRTNAIYSSF